jgi:hypothetical protein
VHAAPRAQDAVELLEYVARNLDGLLVTGEPHLVAAGVRLDAQLLLEQAEIALGIAVELGGCQVVVEGKRVTGIGLYVAQLAAPRFSSPGREEHDLVPTP